MERKLMGVLALTLVLLLGFWLFAAIPSMMGEEVQLRLAPVDPTDFFRGEYLTLRYDISSLNTTLVPADAALDYGDTVYVSLSDGAVAEPVRISHERPASGLFIRGESTGEDWTGNQGIFYGIERYYIPEGTGDVQLDASWTARVKIDSRGNARVLAVLKDGQEVAFRYGEDIIYTAPLLEPEQEPEESGPGPALVSE